MVRTIVGQKRRALPQGAGKTSVCGVYYGGVMLAEALGAALGGLLLGLVSPHAAFVFAGGRRSPRCSSRRGSCRAPRSLTPMLPDKAEGALRYRLFVVIEGSDMVGVLEPY